MAVDDAAGRVVSGRSKRGMLIGVVASLWRYPVKSMLGERCDALQLDQRGVVGDRLYAVRDADGKLGSGKTTRRFRRMDGLFDFRARSVEGVPRIAFPDGTTLDGDDPTIHARLSERLGLPVTLSREAELSHFDASAIHLLTTASLRTMGALLPHVEIDERRFRPNVVLATEGDGFLEDQWRGRDLLVGDAVRLRVTEQTERCVMVTMAQDDLLDEPTVLRELARVNDMCIGVYADVVIPGAIHAGDHVHLV